MISGGMKWCVRHRVRISILAVVLLAEALALNAALPVIREPYQVQNDVRKVFYGQGPTSEMPKDDYLLEVVRSVYSPGYFALVWTFSHWMDPILFGKTLVLILAPLTAVLFFKLGQRMKGCIVGLVLALLFLATHFEAVSEGLQRSFAFPLLAGFLLAVTSKKWVVSAVLVVIAAAVFPPAAVLCGAVWMLQFINIRKGIRLCLSRKAVISFLLAIIASAGIVLPSLNREAGLVVAEFHSIAAYSELRARPEYNPGGRLRIFSDKKVFGVIPMHFLNSRPFGLALVDLPVQRTLLAILIFIGLLICPRAVRQLPRIAWDTLLAGAGAYVLALILVFLLYLPERYAYYSLSLFLLMSASLVISLSAQRLGKWIRHAPKVQSLLLNVVSFRKRLLWVILSTALITFFATAAAAVFFTPHFVATQLSSDGVLQPETIHIIQTLQRVAAGFAVLSALPLVLGIIGVIRPGLVKRAFMSKSVKRGLVLMARIPVPVTQMVICTVVIGIAFAVGSSRGMLQVGSIIDGTDLKTFYQEVASLPADALIAGPLNLDVLNNIPIFSKRSVYMNGEFAELTDEARRRGMAIFDAYYTNSPGALAAFIREEGITHLFVVPALFDRELLKEGYYYHPYRERIVTITAGKEEFVLEEVPEGFAVLKTYDAFLVDCGPPFLQWLESKEGSG